MRKREIGRLAFRVEGDEWVAYYALKETMDGAVRIGSIRMGIVVDSIARKEEFMMLMKHVVDDFLEEAIGERPGWNEPELAPEHEKAGRA